MLITISGTAILLLQKMKKAKKKTNNNTNHSTSTSKPINLKSFFFAFCSGLWCMASRNTTQKKHCRRHSTDKSTTTVTDYSLEWRLHFMRLLLPWFVHLLLKMIFSSHQTSYTHHGELKLDETSTTSVRLTAISHWSNHQNGLVLSPLCFMDCTTLPLYLFWVYSHCTVSFFVECIAKRISNILFVAFWCSMRRLEWMDGFWVDNHCNWRLSLYSMKPDFT